MKKIKSTVLKTIKKHILFMSSCDDLLELIKQKITFCTIYYDIEKAFLDNLSLDFNPSDGLIIIDYDANNYSVTSIIELIEMYGHISLEQFKSTSI